MPSKPADEHRPFKQTEVRGVPKFVWTWLYHLSQAYPDRLLVLFPCDVGTHGMWVEDNRVHTPPGFDARLSEMGSHFTAAIRGDGTATPRFVAWVVVFFTKHGELHGNAMLLDRELHCLTRFEPRGGKPSDYDGIALDALLKKWLHRTVDPTYSYQSPREFQLSVGPQGWEVRDVMYRADLLPDRGPCVIWSLLFIHLMVHKGDGNARHVAHILSKLKADKSSAIQAYGMLIERCTQRQVLPMCSRRR